jgi:BASS family bile acid:Na+ symporter
VESNLFTAVLLPLALALVMLGMGLTLTPADFLRILRRPRAVGLACPMLALPALALLILRLVPVAPPIAVGLLVLALCPVGPASSVITFLARGDGALAVSLTAGLLGDPEMAIPAALYGLWMYGPGVAMVGCGRRAR